MFSNGFRKFICFEVNEVVIIKELSSERLLLREQCDKNICMCIQITTSDKRLWMNEWSLNDNKYNHN